MYAQKILSTCDACRQRKVRCMKKFESDVSCMNCQNRGWECHFSHVKKRKPRKTASAADQEVLEQLDDICRSRSVSFSQTPTDRQSVAQTSVQLPHDNTTFSPETTSPTIVVSHDSNEPPLYQRQHQYVSSCGLSFFSEQNLASLHRQLGHNKVQRLINMLEETTLSQKRISLEGILAEEQASASSILASFPVEARQSYIQSFFERVFPIYPFLDRARFLSLAFGPDLEERLSQDVSWAVLYYCILALGLIHEHEGSFNPFQGEAWRVFMLAVRLYPAMLLTQKSLRVAQASIAMAIFASTYACLPMEEFLITEAARVVVALRLNRRSSSVAGNAEFHRAFWVAYCIEKEYAFNSTQSSVFNDNDIGCPLPPSTDEAEQDINWLHIQVSFTKILSSAYDQLFSRSSLPTPDQCHRIVTSIREQLQHWKFTVPIKFRPGAALRARSFTQPHLCQAALHIRFLYCILEIALARLMIHIDGNQNSSRTTENKLSLMESARAVLESSHLIPLEPSTPINILTMSPLIATFILFDFVVYNPEHIETRRNQTFLEIAAGFFNHVELSTEGTLRGSSIAELASIARDSLTKPPGPRESRAGKDEAANQISQATKETMVLSTTASKPPESELLNTFNTYTLDQLSEQNLESLSALDSGTSYGANGVDTLFYPTFEPWTEYDGISSNINVLSLLQQ